jgi:hypothetical protein
MNLLKLRLLKADVEGMELDIVKGAVKTINMFKPALYLRAHYTPEDNTLSPKTQELARYVQSLNYDMYWHFARLYQARTPCHSPYACTFGQISTLKSIHCTSLQSFVGFPDPIFVQALITGWRRVISFLQEDNLYGNKNNVFGDETLLYILAVPHVDGSTIEGLEPVVVPPA